MTVATQIKTVREERMLQVLLLLLPLLLPLSKQIFNRKFNKQSRTHLLTHQDTYIRSFKKTSVASSLKSSLATDKNEDVFSCDRLFAKPILVYSHMTISKINSQRKLASYFPDEIADCIFIVIRRRKVMRTYFKLNF